MRRKFAVKVVAGPKMYIIEAESEDLAKDFAAEKYLRDRASSMDFDFEVVEL